MSITKIFGAAALLAVLCAPTMSIAAENTSAIARPVLPSEVGCSSGRSYHYRYHYRAYRPRVHVMPRHNSPHKKKQPPIN